MSGLAADIGVLIAPASGLLLVCVGLNAAQAITLVTSN
jgi:hypothetical protein